MAMFINYLEDTNYGYYEAAGRDTGITSILPKSSSICNTGTDTGKYSYPSIFQNFPVFAILEDTGHCQNMSIADTGRFWTSTVRNFVPNLPVSAILV
jgi:hypothetical protein